MSSTGAEALAFVAVGLFGLVVGSFLNVVIARVPAGESIVRPPSSCPECGYEIKAYDNIPVVSYLVLRGRCRNCGAGISVQYPLVEAGCAILWLVAFWRFDGLTWDFAISAVLLAALLALAVIDARTYRLPNAIVYTTFVIGLGLVVAAAATTGDWNRLRDSLIAAVASFGVFVLIYLFGEWMFVSRRKARAARRGEQYRGPQAAFGLGDVKLAGVLGLYLGWLGPAYVVIGLFLGFVFGSLGGSIPELVKRRRSGDKLKGFLSQTMPFGVYLAMGVLIGLLFAQPLADWYLGNLGY